VTVAVGQTSCTIKTKVLTRSQAVWMSVNPHLSFIQPRLTPVDPHFFIYIQYPVSRRRFVSISSFLVAAPQNCRYLLVRNSEDFNFQRSQVAAIHITCSDSVLSTHSKAPYALSFKLSDFTVWRHNWRENWVNCAFLTGNSAGLRTFLYSRLSHRELHSSLKESHSFLSLSAYTTMASSHLKALKKTDKNWQTWWETCAVLFFLYFFYTVKLHGLT
jgi:hypothetical protein